MKMATIRGLLEIALVATLGLLAGCDTSRESSDKHAEGTHEEAAAGTHQQINKPEQRQLTLSGTEADVARMKTAELVERQVQDQVVVTATIQANQDRLAHVAPRVASRIVKVSANLGDRVKQGQTLASLDSLDVGEAHSAYLKARTEAQLAQRNFHRAEGLYKEQIVPQKEYLRVRAEAEIADAAVRAAADRLRLLGVNPGTITGDTVVSVFPLTSPFSGTITEKHAILGELAQPDKSLFTVSDLSTLWIESNVFEGDLAKVRVGAKASVTVAAYPEDTFLGRVAYISSSLDKETRTVRARIEVANRDGRLKPEMFATAAIDTQGSRNVLAVPDEAVVLLQGQPTVFVQVGEVFEPRPVQPGEKLHGEMTLKSGVNAGERVVVRGAYALKAKLLKSQISDTH